MAYTIKDPKPLEVSCWAEITKILKKTPYGTVRELEDALIAGEYEWTKEAHQINILLVAMDPDLCMGA